MGGAVGLANGLTKGDIDGELLVLAEGNALGRPQSEADGESLGDVEGNVLGLADGSYG